MTEQNKETGLAGRAEEQTGGVSPRQEQTAEQTGGAPPHDSQQEPKSAGASGRKRTGRSKKTAQTEAAQTKETPEKTVAQDKAAPAETPQPEPSGQDPCTEPASDAPAVPGPGEPPAQAADGLDPEAERRRVEDMTRTVQVSIEQILAHAAEQEANQTNAGGGQNPVPGVAQPAVPSAPSQTTAHSWVVYHKTRTAADETSDTLARKMGRGAVGLLKWLLLVLFFVLLTAGAGIAMLYRSATPDAIPSITVSLGGQRLEPSSYRWQVPVIGNRFKRDYAETLSTAPYPLAERLDNVKPILTVTPSGLDVQITVKQKDETVFEGTLKEFNAAALPGNGDYSARLVVQQNSSRFDEGGTITGKQTYDFTFTVDVRPTVRLNTQTVPQGGVVAVRVANTPQGETPVLYTEFSHPAFTQNGDIWVCYLPIPADAQPGNYTLQVEANGYRQDLPLAIREGNWISKDYSRESARVTPYIGVEDTPEQVKKLLDGKTNPIAWTETGFVQPFIDSVTQRLTYGTREFVGRNSIQKANNFDNGSARVATCAVVDVGGKRRLIAPADGTVKLAAQLNGTAGRTIVVDHGAGVCSIFYCLGDIAVREGEKVRQGQTLGTAGRTIVAEVRIGEVPVEPFAVWRMQCDAIKTIQ